MVQVKSGANAIRKNADLKKEDNPILGLMGDSYCPVCDRVRPFTVARQEERIICSIDLTPSIEQLPLSRPGKPRRPASQGRLTPNLNTFRACANELLGINLGLEETCIVF